MDANRFASLTRALAVASSRRGTLSALAGALGLWELGHPEDAASARSGKCKPPCGECERCNKGDCDKKDGKKQCKKGKCKPKTDGTGCSGGTCQAGTCLDRNTCGTPSTTCTTSCGPAGTTCVCLAQVGSPGAMCIKGTDEVEPCLSSTTGGCSRPGDVC